MASGRPRLSARSVMRCPLSFCPAPTLFVGKRKRSGLCHCIGCWRQFTPGATRFSNSQMALQVSPRKRWLLRYSPHQRKRGPPPALVVPNPRECVFWQKSGDACSWIDGPTWPGLRPSVGEDYDVNPHAISSSVSDDDEDLNSTARSRPIGTVEESSADSSALEYSQFGSSMRWDKDTASNPGSNVSEPELEEADAARGCPKKRKRLTTFETEPVFKMEKIECRQGCALGGHHERVPETNNLEVEGTKRRRLVDKESKQARGAPVEDTRALQSRKLEGHACNWNHLWKAHEHSNKLGGSAHTRGYLWWKAHEEGSACTQGYL